MFNSKCILQSFDLQTFPKEEKKPYQPKLSNKPNPDGSIEVKPTETPAHVGLKKIMKVYGAH